MMMQAKQLLQPLLQAMMVLVVAQMIEQHSPMTVPKPIERWLGVCVRMQGMDVSESMTTMKTA
jgi:hypothetical protein